jgi:hypothetical protein
VSAKRKRDRAGPKLLASRRFRDGNPGFRHRESLRMQARYEAYAALARKYPAEYVRLYEAELAHLGVGPPPMERPCPCGGTIRRKAPVGAWPKRCSECGGDARSAHRALPPVPDGPGRVPIAGPVRVAVR